MQLPVGKRFPLKIDPLADVPGLPPQPSNLAFVGQVVTWQVLSGSEWDGPVTAVRFEKPDGSVYAITDDYTAEVTVATDNLEAVVYVRNLGAEGQAKIRATVKRDGAVHFRDVTIILLKAPPVPLKGIRIRVGELEP